MYGLSWMVTTDHGGPNHSKLNLTRAYAELKASREMVPEVLQFYGMELNMPAMDHHTLIIPNSEHEASMLYDIESRFDSQEAWPADPSRNTEAQAEARARAHEEPAAAAFGVCEPSVAIGDRRRRLWLQRAARVAGEQYVAPEVYRGMEGAPGHQAGPLAPDGSQKRDAAGNPAGFRGGYSREGAQHIRRLRPDDGDRRWIVGLDARRRAPVLDCRDVGFARALRRRGAARARTSGPASIRKLTCTRNGAISGVLDGLRSGRIFAVAGDLITELDVQAKSGRRTAGIGETLSAEKGQPITLTVKFPRSRREEHARRQPARLARRCDRRRDAWPVGGRERRPQPDHARARAVRRQTMGARRRHVYLHDDPSKGRTQFLRPHPRNEHTGCRAADGRLGESPWPDLWFYSNPIFVEF